MGALDGAAVERALADDPDETMALLVDMAAATDEGLRDLAARLAGRLLVEVARSGEAARRGIGRLESTVGGTDGDVDVDASLDAIAAARASRRPVGIDEMVSRRWVRRDTAVCLLVDRSGSMAGRRLATAALAAAVVAVRYGDAASVLAFADEVAVIQGHGDHRPAATVVDELIGLRGRGTTDVATALRAATREMAEIDASRKVVVLLSDCRSNAGEDAVVVGVAARAACDVAVIAPADDAADARTFAAAIGAGLHTIAAPSDTPEVLYAALMLG